jgi:hypothetical protein
MELNLNKKIKEELLSIRQNRLYESLSGLKDIEDNDFLIVQYLTKTGKLLDEGYTINEIESVSEDFLGKLTQGAGQVAMDGWKNTNVFDALIGGGLGAIKEQVIRWILTQLGVGQGAANAMAAALEQLDPRDLLRVFKTPELCNQKMPEISDAVMAGIRGYIQFGEKSVGLNVADQSKSGLGNIVDELIKQSNLGETIGNKLCGAIWK